MASFYNIDKYHHEADVMTVYITLFPGTVGFVLIISVGRKFPMDQLSLQW